MKYLFIITAFIAVAVTASAQNIPHFDVLRSNKHPYIVKLYPRFDAIDRTNDSLFKQSLNSWATPAGTLISTLNNGTKVYSLYGDHMPCLAPDMNQFNMPNVGKNVKIYTFPERGAIPNVRPKR